MKNLIKSVDQNLVCIGHDFINSLVSILKHNATIGKYSYNLLCNDLYSNGMAASFITNTVSCFCAMNGFKYIRTEGPKVLHISWKHSKESLAYELKSIADAYNLQEDAFKTTLNTLLYVYTECMVSSMCIKFDSIYSAYIVNKLCSEYSHIFKLSNTDTGHIYIEFIR